MQRLGIAKITGHQLVRGRGDEIAEVYETHWDGLLRSSWERESNLGRHRRVILLYWIGFYPTSIN